MEEVGVDEVVDDREHEGEEDPDEQVDAEHAEHRPDRDVVLVADLADQATREREGVSATNSMFTSAVGISLNSPGPTSAIPEPAIAAEHEDPGHPHEVRMGVAGDQRAHQHEPVEHEHDEARQLRLGRRDLKRQRHEDQQQDDAEAVLRLGGPADDRLGARASAGDPAHRRAEGGEGLRPGPVTGPRS